MISREELINDGVKKLEGIYNMLQRLPEVSIKELNNKQTVLVIVDMINGFAREGVLMSKRVEDIIPSITEISKMCDVYKIKKLAFADSHTMVSPEFETYPPHCLNGTSEADIVDELKAIGGYKLIPKNSTNGFLEDEFQIWLKENDGITNFIVTGDCTDICIQQFAITLKTWFNIRNRKARVIVPMSAVETYDLELHDANLMNVMALYNMILNGVEVVERVI